MRVADLCFFFPERAGELQTLQLAVWPSDKIPLSIPILLCGLQASQKTRHSLDYQLVLLLPGIACLCRALTEWAYAGAGGQGMGF